MSKAPGNVTDQLPWSLFGTQLLGEICSRLYLPYQNVRPYKAEMITPDRFAIACEARDKGGRQIFFVAFIDDHLKTQEDVSNTIKSWYGHTPIGYLDKNGIISKQDKVELIKIRPFYSACIAVMPKPNDDTYFAKVIYLSKDNKLGDEINKIPPKQAKAVKKLITEIEIKKATPGALSPNDSHVLTYGYAVLINEESDDIELFYS